MSWEPGQHACLILTLGSWTLRLKKVGQLQVHNQDMQHYDLSSQVTMKLYYVDQSSLLQYFSNMIPACEKPLKDFEKIH